MMLALFDLTYILRFAYDVQIASFPVRHLDLAVTTLWVGIVFDILPIVFILFIHSWNFRIIESNTKPLDTDEKSENSANISVDMLSSETVSDAEEDQL